MFLVEKMLENVGKFLMYSSRTQSPERLKIVGSAVSKVRIR